METCKNLNDNTCYIVSTFLGLIQKKYQDFSILVSETRTNMLTNVMFTLINDLKLTYLDADSLSLLKPNVFFYR